ncbi:hypothetical protein EU77_00805 [Mesotoga sp. SC_NapDC]|jgi:oligoribonuclease NrnB/cAMP/cGMP phosphodiesterase (DHH superfamily)|nr:hypothetical protein EU77_00805 [Mesotoga sp. SC_NapDC]
MKKTKKSETKDKSYKTYKDYLEDFGPSFFEEELEDYLENCLGDDPYSIDEYVKIVVRSSRPSINEHR